MKKTKILFSILLLLLILTVSCKRPDLNSLNAQPAKKTVVVANPMWTFNRINSNQKVAVNAFILITGVNGAFDTGTYFSKNQVFQVDNNGNTPAFLHITDVNLPSNGPYLVQVFLESIHCTVFPIVPNGCTNTIGARAKYTSSKTITPNTPTPTGNFLMNQPVNQPGICCN